MKSIFEKAVAAEFIARINQLTAESKPIWGKMNVAQMLAHCSVTYEMIYDDKHPKPNRFTKFLLKKLIKGTVVGDKPYKKNSRTAPAFMVAEERNFLIEKQRLIDFINKTQALGESHFDGAESHSFGALTSKEWNTMFYKHLDHHLSQFSE